MLTIVIMLGKYWNLNNTNAWKILIFEKYSYLNSIDTEKVLMHLMLKKYGYFWYLKSIDTFNTWKVLFQMMLILRKWYWCLKNIDTWKAIMFESVDLKSTDNFQASKIFKYQCFLKTLLYAALNKMFLKKC